MEHNSSSDKQLRKQTTTRAVMNKKNKVLKVDINENDEKIDDISQEIIRNKKAIGRKRQKGRKYRELSSSLIELTFSKTDIRNNIDEFKQIISHVE